MADISLSTKNFNSGKFGVGFRATATEASVSHLFEFSTAIGGDNTNAKFSCYVDSIQMSCGSQGGAHIRDGSAGDSIVGALAGISGSSYSEKWDFRDDPLVCLTADGTSVLSVDMTLAGKYQGYVKYHFGPPPTA